MRGSASRPAGTGMGMDGGADGAPLPGVFGTGAGGRLATRPHGCSRTALALAFAAAAARYWLSVYPRVLREIRRWRERAREIPDPALRRLALESLREERGNLEGAAAFAVLAPRAERARVVRALVAFQAIYDYADTLAEQPSFSDSAANGRQLHLALLDAVDSGGGCADHYAYSAWREDGGYLRELIEACATELAALPGYAAVSASAAEAIARMVDFQSFAHDGRGDFKAERLARWAEAQTPPASGLEWWETAAGAASSLLVFALIAHAAGPNAAGPNAAGTNAVEAQAVTKIERAYFPWIGALHVLLDSLVDRADDARAGRHSLVEHYGSPAELAGRLRAVTTGAVRASETLPDAVQHGLILAAMASFYLSQPAASSPAGAPARAEILATLGGRATLAMWLFRLRAGLRARRSGRRRGDDVGGAAGDMGACAGCTTSS